MAKPPKYLWDYDVVAFLCTLLYHQKEHPQEIAYEFLSATHERKCITFLKKDYHNL
jgi:hypothetical protein